ncbi:MAG TPA: chorismate mutase [Solimonas sp.]|nr:chorismate mutase [Solimonas sp.]
MTPKHVRGLRGAITVEHDEPALVLAATRRLLAELQAKNHFDPDDIVSALFTVTPDIVSEYPGAAVRRIGWTLVPVLNFVEIDVPGRLARCIRVLLHVHTAMTPAEMRHVYLEGAAVLRPDFVQHTAAHR